MLLIQRECISCCRLKEQKSQSLSLYDKAETIFDYLYFGQFLICFAVSSWHSKKKCRTLDKIFLKWHIHAWSFLLGWKSLCSVLSYRLKETPSDPGVCFDAFWGYFLLWIKKGCWNVSGGQLRFFHALGFTWDSVTFRAETAIPQYSLIHCH